jgi:hypothetical protein
MTLDRVCDEIEQKRFQQKTEVCGWMGGLGMCVLCFFFCVARINGEIGSEFFLLLKYFVIKISERW